MSYSLTLNKKEAEYIIDNLTFDLVNDSDCGRKIIKRLKRILRPIKISSRKQKGRGLQKWVCQQIAVLFGIEYDQQDDQCLVHSREMGQSGTDVILRGLVKDLFPFDIECKSSEQLNLLQTIRQAEKNTGNGRYWIVVHKKKALCTPIVVMDWRCFYAMNKRLLKGEIHGNKETT